MRRKEKRRSVIEQFRDEMRSGFAEMRSRFEMIEFRADEARKEMRDGFTSVDARFDKVMGHLVALTGEAFNFRESRVTFGAMLREHRLTLESHDRRLGALESRLPPPTP